MSQCFLLPAATSTTSRALPVTPGTTQKNAPVSHPAHPINTATTMHATTITNQPCYGRINHPKVDVSRKQSSVCVDQSCGFVCGNSVASGHPKRMAAGSQPQRAWRNGTMERVCAVTRCPQIGAHRSTAECSTNLQSPHVRCA
eukprot:40945-Chlamydomonas_euryale.AAC.3